MKVKRSFCFMVTVSETDGPLSAFVSKRRDQFCFCPASPSGVWPSGSWSRCDPRKLHSYFRLVEFLLEDLLPYTVDCL